MHRVFVQPTRLILAERTFSEGGNIFSFINKSQQYSTENYQNTVVVLASDTAFTFTFYLSIALSLWTVCPFYINNSPLFAT